MKEAQRNSVTTPLIITHEVEGVWFLQNDFKHHNKSSFKKKKKRVRKMCDKILASYDSVSSYSAAVALVMRSIKAAAF